MAQWYGSCMQVRAIVLLLPATSRHEADTYRASGRSVMGYSTGSCRVSNRASTICQRGVYRCSTIIASCRPDAGRRRPERPVVAILRSEVSSVGVHGRCAWHSELSLGLAAPQECPHVANSVGVRQMGFWGMRCVGEGGVRVPGPAVQAVGQARMSVESAGKRRS